MLKINLAISGMHCSSCAGIIERSLKKVPGVSEVQVNFAAEKASVVFDDALTKQENLILAIEKAGYLVFFMFIEVPYKNILSLVLAAPVQFIIGAGFYKGAWSAWRMRTFNMDSLIAIGSSVAFFNYFCGFGKVFRNQS